MTDPIYGPRDVKPGELVDYHKHGFRTITTQVAVVRVTKSGLVVRMPDGTEIRRGYSVMVDGGAWNRGKRSHVNFDKLSAHDLWEAARPVTTTCAVELRGGVLIKRDQLRDAPDLVLAEVRAIAEWLGREPKGTP